MKMPLLVPNHPQWRPAVRVFAILSALMLSTCGTKEPVMTAKQTPRCAPGYNYLLYSLFVLSTQLLLCQFFHEIMIQ